MVWYIASSARPTEIDVKNYDPVTNGQQAMDLQVAFDVSVIRNKALDTWIATIRENKCSGNGIGSTPNKAIVRAVIASVYDDFVEVEEA